MDANVLFCRRKKLGHFGLAQLNAAVLGTQANGRATVLRIVNDDFSGVH
jgi:hypothetical protein